MVRAVWNWLGRGLALLLCLGPGYEDPERPLDGGRPLRFGRWAGPDTSHGPEPCWRREKGGWHHSAGHCAPTTAPAIMAGVWVTAFEETSFLPGEKARPDPRDPRRFTTEIELDEGAVMRSIGGWPDGPGGQAVYLRFAGRRIRDPVAVDCNGTPHFIYVVDRMIEARYLGPMDPIPPGWWEQLARNVEPARVKRLHEGRWGELEADAARRCRAGPPADRLED